MKHDPRMVSPEDLRRSQIDNDLREVNRRLQQYLKTGPPQRYFYQQEVIEDKKPRLRDYFNPMFYIRKELQKIMDIVTRLETSVSALQTGVADLATKITAETAQHAAWIEELRGLATNPNMSAEQTARLSAIADSLDTSVAGLNAAATAVSNIVPDASVPAPTPSGTTDTPPVVPVVDEPPAGEPVAVDPLPPGFPPAEEPVTPSEPVGGNGSGGTPPTTPPPTSGH